MNSALGGKVVVVTGGAGLLGRTFVAEIAKRGGTAVLADIDLMSAKTLAEAMADRSSGRVIPMHLDITDPASVDMVIAEVAASRGRIDAVVNSAYPRNSAFGRQLEDVTYSDFCENLNLHLGGYFLVSQRFARYFRANGGGNIVNMSSIYGTITPRFGLYSGTSMTMPVEYAAIKAAIIHMTRYFAQFYKRDGVRVNCISPGGVLDGQPELFVIRYSECAGSKGLLGPTDVVGALAFMLSDESRYITGQNLVVDDGFSL